MSNWEPEEVSDADMEGIAGGAGSKDFRKEKKKPMPGSDPGSDPMGKDKIPGADGKKK